MGEFWTCNVCEAQNHIIDGECQYCDCLGADCKRDDCSGDHGPQEGDLTTEDFIHFYQDGKLVVTATCNADICWKPAVEAFMAKEQFWPDVWSISDHGNVDRVSM